MNVSLRLTGLCLALCLSTITNAASILKGTGSTENAVVITIIYDNYQENPSLETDWGFACLVEYKGNRLLFDAGRRAGLFKENMGKLEIDPGDIPSLFISHAHGDHTAGIPWITGSNPQIKCYLPSTYASDLKSEGKLPPNSTGLLNPEHLYGPFYSTGDHFKRFREHGLVVKTEDGGVLITGCGHPGVVEMVTVAKEELGIRIHTVIGGLHLLQTPDDQVNKIASILQEKGVERICPTHCTGDQAIAALKESFGKGYISGGTGKIISIE
jgi:7,8-dihydropterin-6-yl-methyl-4-(beta-D-ribofuranosyl)aminobenzene 5'-phosphate synthase